MNHVALRIVCSILQPTSSQYQTTLSSQCLYRRGTLFVMLVYTSVGLRRQRFSGVSATELTVGAIGAPSLSQQRGDFLFEMGGVFAIRVAHRQSGLYILRDATFVHS